MSLSLRELQEKFQKYILNKDPEVLDCLAPTIGSLATEQRIDIYQEGYTARLLEGLEKDLSTLSRIVGLERFKEIARGYINHYPSNHFSISQFSRYISQYLLEAYGQEPHFSEMATFELALARVLTAPDGDHLTLADLAVIQPESWPTIQFMLHPSVEIHSFYFNVPQIVSAHMNTQMIPNLNHYEQPVSWIIWRYALHSYFESLTAAQVGMIQAIRERKTFSEICEGLTEWLPEEEVAQFAAGSFRNWIEKGVFTSYICSATILKNQ